MLRFATVLCLLCSLASVLLCVVSCVMCNMLRLPSTADRQQVLVDACKYVRNSSDGIYRQLRQFPVLLLVCMSTAGSMTRCCYATAAGLLLRDCYATATQLLLPVSVRLLVLCSKPCLFVNMLNLDAVLCLLYSLAYFVFCACCALLRIL